MHVTVIGGGLAGSESAWQLALRGIRVLLIEMRPLQMTGIHRSGNLAELVCSNSLKSQDTNKASGVLKQEMTRLDSLVLQCAVSAAIPGGSALTVDREIFSRMVTARLSSHPLITVSRLAVEQLPEGETIVATGPLTTPALAVALQQVVGNEWLSFYDAVAPVVAAESLDLTRLFKASRYEKGDAAYLNSPLSQVEYDGLREAIMGAEQSPLHEGDGPTPFFESCLPIEVLAQRGRLTMRYGPLRGAGLTDPRTGRWPFACVQLRAENNPATMFNLVGFQTRLKWPEQVRIVRLIPGLENAEILRYGVMHRNIFVNSPRVLGPNLQVRARDGLWLAGQITGVEGYVESTAMGLIAGISCARRLQGKPEVHWPRETVLGALLEYLHASAPASFQPMNANWGLLPVPEKSVKKADKIPYLVERAQKHMEELCRVLNQ